MTVSKDFWKVEKEPINDKFGVAEIINLITDITEGTNIEFRLSLSDIHNMNFEFRFTNDSIPGGTGILSIELLDPNDNHHGYTNICKWLHLDYEVRSINDLESTLRGLILNCSHTNHVQGVVDGKAVCHE